MISEQVTIINRLGLHARAAAKFVNVANRFGSSVKVLRASKEVDGKSIMSVMMLGAAQGTQLELKIQGQDEHEAYAALLELIQNKFDEGE